MDLELLNASLFLAAPHASEEECRFHESVIDAICLAPGVLNARRRGLL